MKKDFEKQNELIGLEEINQVETSEVNGGLIFDIPPYYCCHDIPPMIPNDKRPWEISFPW